MPDDITKRLADALRSLFDQNSVHPTIHAHRARQALAAYDALSAQPPAAFDEARQRAEFEAAYFSIVNPGGESTQHWCWQIWLPARRQSGQGGG